MFDSESPRNLFPCRLPAPLPFPVAFLYPPPSPGKVCLTCPGCLLLSRLPLSQPRLLIPPPPKAGPEGYGGPLRAAGTSAEITRLTALLHFPGMKLVIRRRRSWLLICVTLQLTAFLACTIFRPQTTPFFCVWKACSSCWALGTNPALYRELRKLLSPKRTAIRGHLD